MKDSIHYSWKTELIPVISLLLTIAVSIYSYGVLPERIASHWDIQGNINGYSSKLSILLLFPLLSTGLYLLFIVLPRFDPMRKNYKHFEKSYHAFRNLIACLFLFIFLLICGSNIGIAIPVTTVVFITIGIFITLTGLLLKNIKRNWFFGIRTPWTLSSDTVWNKTHTFGGAVFAIIGILFISVPFIGLPGGLILSIAGTILGTGITILYSLLVYNGWL